MIHCNKFCYSCLMNKTSYNNTIADYYRKSGWLYKLFIYSRKSLGMHFGFWDKNTKNYDESVVNQFREVVRVAHIRKGMKVLDAGCGVGGGAIYIAKNTGAKVWGISITSEQIKEAKTNAERSGVESLTSFEVMDFSRTTFSKNTFNVIFGIESVCHAYPKQNFLDEMYKILKPGGILYLSDGYQLRKPSNLAEQNIVSILCRVWRLKELINFSKMSDLIRGRGFTLLKVESKSDAVRPTFKYMNFLIRISYPLTFLSRYSKSEVLSTIADNSDSMRNYILGDSLGLVGHYVHVAKK
jgi:tocopherol O-methyltransferase